MGHWVRTHHHPCKPHSVSEIGMALARPVPGISISIQKPCRVQQSGNVLDDDVGRTSWVKQNGPFFLMTKETPISVAETNARVIPMTLCEADAFVGTEPPAMKKERHAENPALTMTSALVAAKWIT